MSVRNEGSVRNSCSVEDIKDSTPTKVETSFEAAIEAAGFGIFNVCFLFVALLGAMSAIFESSTMSYIAPSAECDLNLTLIDKGMLNGITYAGMITSAIFWGYLADTKGRRKPLIFGYFADVVCVLGGALSQNFVQLMICKYLGGLVMSGPFAILMTYINELHGKQHRSRVMMAVGIMFAIGNLTLPLMAIAVLPQQWNLNIFRLQLHSWQVFLALTAVPSLLCGLFLQFLPESPKFLMSQGRNNEALEVFRTIYALNKRQPCSTYPVKQLAIELHHVTRGGEVGLSNTTELGASRCMPLHDGLRQMRPLFAKPYLLLSMWVYCLNFCVLLSQNTIRLWLPQLFASFTELERLLEPPAQRAESSVCAILEYSRNRTSQMSTECTVDITIHSYANNLIVGAASVCAYTIVGCIINRVGVKRILTICLFMGTVCALLMFWAASPMHTIILASLLTTLGSVSSTSVLTVSVALFPTSLRTMVISLEMMFGRLGSFIGNLLFPALISWGCLPPFLMVSIFFCSGGMLAAFLPFKNKTSLI